MRDDVWVWMVACFGLLVWRHDKLNTAIENLPGFSLLLHSLAKVLLPTIYNKQLLLCFSNLMSNEVWCEVTEENNLSTVLLSKTKHKPLSSCWLNILVLFVYFHYFQLYSMLQMLVLIFIWSYMGFCWIGTSCMLGKLKILLLQNVRRLHFEIRPKGKPRAWFNNLITLRQQTLDYQGK